MHKVWIVCKCFYTFLLTKCILRNIVKMQPPTSTAGGSGTHCRDCGKRRSKFHNAKLTNIKLASGMRNSTVTASSIVLSFEELIFSLWDCQLVYAAFYCDAYEYQKSMKSGRTVKT